MIGSKKKTNNQTNLHGHLEAALAAQEAEKCNALQAQCHSCNIRVD